MSQTHFTLTGSKMTPDDVFESIDARDLQQLRNALKSGVELQLRDEFGDTPLHRAVRQRLPEFVSCCCNMVLT